MSTGEMHWVLITDAPLSLDWPDNHLLDLELDGKKSPWLSSRRATLPLLKNVPMQAGGWHRAISIR